MFVMFDFVHHICLRKYEHILLACIHDSPRYILGETMLARLYISHYVFYIQKMSCKTACLCTGSWIY